MAKANGKGRRAGNTEGSLYKRESDGKWCAALKLPDGTRRVFYGRTRHDAAERLHEAKENVKKALPVAASRETLARFLERWLRDVVTPKARASTLVHYRGDVERHIVPALGNLKLSELTVARLQAWITELSAGGIGARTVGHCRAVLRVALRQAWREGLIGQNPAALVTVPRHTPPAVAPLSPAAARAIIAAFAGHEYEALVIVALATGLRAGELLGLSWDATDPDAGTLRVERQLQRVAGAYELVEPKTERSRRTLVLPPVAVEALRRQRVRQAEARLYAGAGWQDWGLVFTTAAGAPIHGSTLTHRFQARLAAAGLDRIRWHDLRHGCAALLLADGTSLRVVMEQLGHSQIAVTANIYAHVVPALLADAANTLDRALGGGDAAAV